VRPRVGRDRLYDPVDLDLIGCSVHTALRDERHCRPVVPEFAVTVAVAIVLFVIVSLTLIPVMCGRVLTAQRDARPGTDQRRVIFLTCFSPISSKV
jgi:hypothetical protein